MNIFCLSRCYAKKSLATTVGACKSHFVAGKTVLSTLQIWQLFSYNVRLAWPRSPPDCYVSPHVKRDSDMGTQMNSAQDMLFGTTGLRVSNFKMFPGSNREVTTEQIAAEIRRSMGELVHGAAEDLAEEI